MKQITFIPDGFESGFIYDARLIKDNTVIETISNLIELEDYSFEVDVPGNYVVSISKRGDDSCTVNQSVQALFPVVTHIVTSTDCVNNTYTFTITLTNPTTAGTNVQYGWSIFNDHTTVTNWTGNGTLIVPADDTFRYFFVKNATSCAELIAQSSNSPCITCNLSVSGISFVCNG